MCFFGWDSLEERECNISDVAVTPNRGAALIGTG